MLLGCTNGLFQKNRRPEGVTAIYRNLQKLCERGQDSLRRWGCCEDDTPTRRDLNHVLVLYPRVRRLAQPPPQANLNIITGGPVLLTDCICIDERANNGKHWPRLIVPSNRAPDCPTQFNAVFFLFITPLMCTFYTLRCSGAYTTYRLKGFRPQQRLRQGSSVSAMRFNFPPSNTFWGPAQPMYFSSRLPLILVGIWNRGYRSRYPTF